MIIYKEILRLSGALICLFCGLLLWDNLALHFAEIEGVLPLLRSSDILQGKTLFILLIFISSGYALFTLSRIPARILITSLNHPLRITAALATFAVSFVPLFWLRFGGSAWLILILLAIAFLLNLTGLLVLASWFADRIRLPEIRLSRFWSKINPWLPAALLFGTALYFTNHCFGLIPHIEDSIAQLLQARIFASGHFTAEPFIPQEFFFYGFMIDTDLWFSQYPPGHPLMLCLGVLAGAPYLVNPLLGFAGVILFYYLIKSVESARYARWGAWLMALSPYVIFMSAGFMNHTTALVFSLLGWLGLKKGEGGKQGWLILSGLAFGYCAATRPLEGAIFAFLGGVYLLYKSGSVKISSFMRAAPYSIAFFAVFSIYPIHNWMTTGDPLLTGYHLTWGGNGLGFGEINWGAAHTFGYGLVNTFMSIAGLNVYLYEIPIPALLGIFLWAIFGAKLNRWDKLMLSGMILVPAAYLFYYFHDYCFGPRYYYVIAPQLIYFSIKGVIAIYHLMTEKLKLPSLTAQHRLVWMGIILLALQFFFAVPYRASVYADGYWGTDDSPMEEAKRLNLENAIVFIENHPWETLQTKLHSLGFIMGDAHRLLFSITAEGLNEVLSEMSIEPDEVWDTEVDLDDIEERIAAWHESYIEAGNPPIDPWRMEGYSTYYSNGAVHLDPRNRNPNVILARDLGDHNRKLIDMYPDRKAYRYGFDARVGRFRILPCE